MMLPQLVDGLSDVQGVLLRDLSPRWTPEPFCGLKWLIVTSHILDLGPLEYSLNLFLCPPKTNANMFVQLRWPKARINPFARKRGLKPIFELRILIPSQYPELLNPLRRKSQAAASETKFLSGVGMRLESASGRFRHPRGQLDHMLDQVPLAKTSQISRYSALFKTSRNCLVSRYRLGWWPIQVERLSFRIRPLRPITECCTAHIFCDVRLQRRCVLRPKRLECDTTNEKTPFRKPNKWPTLFRSLQTWKCWSSATNENWLGRRFRTLTLC